MITFQSLSKPGNREVNEDSIGIVNKDSYDIFALADGLGGQGKGNIASGHVVDKILNDFEENNISLVDEIKSCHASLTEYKNDNDIVEDMMTTLVLLEVEEDVIHWGNVGDSRLYYFKNGELCSRTTDHSVPQVLVSSGEIEESEIRHHPDRNRLLRALGMDISAEIITKEDSVNREGRQAFLMCSDGFWEYIEEEHMCKQLKKSKTVDSWLKRMEKIVLKNGKKYNMDNYSAIAVWIE